MWSRNSPFTLISIGGERHSKDPRFWVEEPDVNNTSKQSWVSFSDEFELKFSELSRAELKRFPSRVKPGWGISNSKVKPS